MAGENGKWNVRTLPTPWTDWLPCAARFTRLAADISFGESRLELALDRGTLLGGSKEAPISEVEAELKSGQDADALAFGALLESTYGLAPEQKSKFKRARDLALEGR